MLSDSLGFQREDQPMDGEEEEGWMVQPRLAQRVLSGLEPGLGTLSRGLSDRTGTFFWPAQANLCLKTEEWWLFHGQWCLASV